ncbi:MAG: InlB B-repeat-containing protein, partial [Spirochaetales bacterium]|nr:InlB B-repeat-containing protein [Spirochaetales bacterium]
MSLFIVGCPNETEISDTGNGKTTTTNKTPQGGGSDNDSYTVVYNNQMDPMSNAVAANYSASEDVVLANLSQYGYKFLGWFDGTSDTAQKITGWEAGTKTDTVILWARWEPITVTVTLVHDAPFNGQPVELGTVTATYGEYLPTYGSSTGPANYIFTGYYTEKDRRGIRYYDEEGQGCRIFKSTSDMTLYSGWAEVTSSGSTNYGLTWKGSLATAPTSPQTGWAYYNTATKKSYIYDGSAWQILAQDGTDGQDGKDASGDQTGTGGPAYTVVFDANGGSGTIGKLICEIGGDYAIPECSFIAPDGMEFAYWSVGTTKLTGTSFTDLSTTDGATVTLTANWKYIINGIYLSGFEGVWAYSNTPNECPQMTSTDGNIYTYTVSCEMLNPTPYGIKFVSDRGNMVQFVRAEAFELGSERSVKYVASDEEIPFVLTTAEEIDATDDNGDRIYHDDNTKIYLEETIVTGTVVTVTLNLETMTAKIAYSGTGDKVNSHPLDEVSPQLFSSLGDNRIIPLSLDQNMSDGNTYVYSGEFTFDADENEYWGQDVETEMAFIVTESTGWDFSEKFGGASVKLGKTTNVIYQANKDAVVSGLIDGHTYSVIVTATAFDDKLEWADSTIDILITDNDSIYVAGFNGIWPGFFTPGECPEMKTTDGNIYTVTLLAESDNPTPYGIKFVTNKGFAQQFVRAVTFTLGTARTVRYLDSNVEEYFIAATEAELEETDGLGESLYVDDNTKIYMREKVLVGSSVTITFNRSTGNAFFTYNGTGVT